MKRKNNRNITIKDIARETGYSIATVSRVLNNTGQYYNEKTAKIVLEAADRLNYSPHAMAKGLKSHRTSLIAYLVQTLNDDYYTELYHGILAAADELGYTIIILTSNYDPVLEEKNIRQLRTLRCDGVIIATGLLNQDLMQDLCEDFPVVTIDNVPGNDVPYIAINDKEIAYDATKYLIGLGHRKIAYLSGILQLIPLELRYEGHKEALRECGVEKDCEAHFVPFLDEVDYELCAGFVKKILSEREFTALMLISDLGAVAALRAVYELGLKVPEDISIIGFDNLAISQYSIPALSTVSPDKHEMGYQGALMLHQVIEGQAVNPKVIKAVLVPRSSTGPAKKQRSKK